MKGIISEEVDKHSVQIEVYEMIKIEWKNGVKYVFIDFPWRDKLIFSFREKRKEGGVIETNSSNFPLPKEVEKYVKENYGEYEMVDRSIKYFRKKTRDGILITDRGDLYERS